MREKRKIFLRDALKKVLMFYFPQTEFDITEEVILVGETPISLKPLYRFIFPTPFRTLRNIEALSPVVEAVLEERYRQDAPGIPFKQWREILGFQVEFITNDLSEQFGLK